MAKRLFYFSLGLLVLVLIFLGAYNFAFRHNVNDPVADPSKKTSLNPTASAPAPQKTSALETPLNEHIFGAALGDDGWLYYYSVDDHSLKKASPEGKNKTVLMSNLPGEVMRLLWSAKKDRVLLLLNQNGTSLWYSANTGNKSLAPLKPEISRLAWDNLGEKVFYQYTDHTTGKRSMNSANPDGSNWKKLTDLSNTEYYLSAVPGSSTVAFWNRPQTSVSSTLESVGLSGENRHVLTKGLYGADYLWSPNGEHILASGGSSANSSTYGLHLIERDSTTKDLAIPTLITKAAWSTDSRTIYYALPGGLPANSLLPDDYFGKNLHTQDTLWKLDIATNKKTRLLELADTPANLDSSELFVSPDDDSLYLTNRTDQRLYHISL